MQNYARKFRIPIDLLDFNYEFMTQEKIESKPVNMIFINTIILIALLKFWYLFYQPIGAYIEGLYLESAKWCNKTNQIQESDPKVLYHLLPVVLLKPSPKQNVSILGRYQCPVYKTSIRRGVLSTTGHSTNFVFTINLPTDTDQKFWINRGLS